MMKSTFFSIPGIEQEVSKSSAMPSKTDLLAGELMHVPVAKNLHGELVFKTL